MEKITREFLIQKHINENLSILKIAKICNSNYSKIWSLLKKFNITKYKDWDKVITKEFLIEEYVNKENSAKTISKKIGCAQNTVLNKIHRFKMVVEDSLFEKVLTKEYLLENYVRKGLSTYQIAKLVDCGDDTIRRFLIKFKIPLRGLKEKYTIAVRKKMSLAAKKDKERIKNLLKVIQASPNKFEIKCLNYLNRVYINKFKYVGDGSLMIGSYSVDAYSEELKTIALFHGDYWHCNPKKYKANFYHKQFKKTAQEIWEKDGKVIEIFEQAGYKVIVIWEDEINKLLESVP
jgi:G:T-mismatch repair DNA endonuclease (very short patch repair protein)